MNRLLQGLVIALGFLLMLLPQDALAQNRQLAEARAAVKQSGDQSISALDSALSRVSDPEAKAALEQARREVLQTQTRAFRDLDLAENGAISRLDGLNTAYDATKRFQEALDRAMAKAPEPAQGALLHASGAALHGHNTVKSLLEGTDRPAPPALPSFGQPSGPQTRPGPAGPGSSGFGGGLRGGGVGGRGR